MPPTQWTFAPLPSPLPDLLIYGVMGIATTAFAWHLLSPLPLADLWFVKLLCLFWFIGWLIFIINLGIRLRWYNENAEYLCVDNDCLHFHVYPHSGSLKYTEITQTARWYIQDREPGEHRWEVGEKDIGIILFTQQGKIQLNLERMIQNLDGISFCNNSNIVIDVLSQRTTLDMVAV